MYVTAVKANGYKNLKNAVISPHPEYNLITGMNAQGKTNLLEAIWLMTGCRSFRGSKDRDYISIDGNIMELGMAFYDGRRTQKIEYSMSRENIRDKKIKLNGCCNNTKQTFECGKKSTFKGHFLRRNHEYFTDSNQCKIHTFKPRSLLTARLCRGVQGCCGACGIHDKQSKGLHS